jgi:hypothetical protein
MNTAPDLAQAAYLELALRALENADRPALLGSLAALDSATLDRLARLIPVHPLWSALLADLIPVSATE